MTRKFYTLLLLSFLGLSTHALASVATVKLPVSSHRVSPTLTEQQNAEVSVAVSKKATFRKKALKRLLFSEPDKSERFDGLATAGFVCGVVGLVTLVLGIGILLGILAIIFSAIALNRVKRTGRRGRGLAIAGLVLGIVTLAILGLALVALLFV